MRSLNSAICTSGLPVSLGCAAYWSMRDFFCSLASTTLMHSCLQFQFFSFVTLYMVTGWGLGCKGKGHSETAATDLRGLTRIGFFERKEGDAESVEAPGQYIPSRLYSSRGMCRVLTKIYAQHLNEIEEER